MSESLGAVAPLPPPPALAGDPWWAAVPWTRSVGVLGFGLAADLLVRGPIGVGVPILVLTAVLAIVVVVRPRPAALPFLFAAPIVVAFTAFRASTVLAILDIAVGLALLGIGASFARAGDPLGERLRNYAARALLPLGSIRPGVEVPSAPFARAMFGRRGSRGLVRVLAIVAPVVAILVVLFGSADAVFAHYAWSSVDWLPTPSGVPGHLVFVAVGAVALSTMFVCASEVVSGGPVEAGAGSRPLRRSEWAALLAAVDVVFAAFVLVQFAAFFGGRSRVIESRGLTFAQYARTGFLQLLVASTITAGLIAGSWALGQRARRRDELVFCVLSGALVVLTLVVLASAFWRLTLYEGAYGWTWPRLLGHAAVIFLATCLALGLAWILLGRGRWLPTAIVAAGIVTVLALNLVNPDRFIAARNAERYRGGAEVDVSELTGLSVDATPILVPLLPSLQGAQYRSLERHLACEREDLQGEHGGLGSWNAGKSDAMDSLESAPLDACNSPSS